MRFPPLRISHDESESKVDNNEDEINDPTCSPSGRTVMMQDTNY